MKPADVMYWLKVPNPAVRDAERIVRMAYVEIQPYFEDDPEPPAPPESPDSKLRTSIAAIAVSAVAVTGLAGMYWGYRELYPVMERAAEADITNQGDPGTVTRPSEYPVSPTSIKLPQISG